MREWLDNRLAGEFAALRGLGGPGREHEAYDERLAWDRHLAAAGWTCLGWPVEHGGRGATLAAAGDLPRGVRPRRRAARVNHLGEELLGPTLIAFGTPEQQQRFLPPIKALRRAVVPGLLRARRRLRPGRRRPPARTLDGDEWSITGQKVWTSLAHLADWCFVARPHRARLDAAPRPVLPAGADAPARRRRPADPAAHRHVGVQRGLLRRRPHRRRARRRRGRRRLAGRHGHARLRARRGHARPAGRLPPRARRADRPGPRAPAPPTTRCCATSSPVPGSACEVMRAHALRTLASVTPARTPGTEAVGGEAALGALAPRPRRAGDGGARRRRRWSRATDGLDDWQRLFLFTRADTIYGGSDEIQRNIIAERTLGLPREARGMTAARPTSAGHALLAGKVVVVTASAGAGIGWPRPAAASRRARGRHQRHARAPPRRDPRRSCAADHGDAVAAVRVRRHRRGAGRSA